MLCCCISALFQGSLRREFVFLLFTMEIESSRREEGRRKRTKLRRVWITYTVSESVLGNVS